jgi:hypothetical protein
MGMSLNDAADVISTAAALGMEIPAPTGTLVYTALVTNGWDDNARFLGVWPSEATACEAAARWLSGELSGLPFTPWAESSVEMTGREPDYFERIEQMRIDYMNNLENYREFIDRFLPQLPGGRIDISRHALANTVRDSPEVFQPF